MPWVRSAKTLLVSKVATAVKNQGAARSLRDATAKPTMALPRASGLVVKGSSGSEVSANLDAVPFLQGLRGALLGAVTTGWP